MSIERLDEVLYEQFVQDVGGLLSWMNDQVDADIPSDPETARAVADDALDPKWIFWTGLRSDIAREMWDLIEESRLLRLVMARSALYRWASEITHPLIPDRRGPAGSPPPGPGPR